jgi:hypothetical protein
VRPTGTLGKIVRVRFPQPLLEQLQERALASDRSVSTEIRPAVRAPLEPADVRDVRPQNLEWR